MAERLKALVLKTSVTPQTGTVGSNPTPFSKFMNKEEFLTNNRIYAIVTSTVKTPLAGVLEMEKGRMAAQACHAVSGLKLMNTYLNGSAKEKREWLKAYTFTPVTTIILQCRDQKELEHVASLAKNKGLDYFRFYDTNQPFYMTTDKVFTAIAIGPTSKLMAEGMCDYLPLFQ